MELWQLRYFVAVAEAEHIGKAAEHLNMSQSPLSHQIRRLEQQLGVELFERVKKRIRLTAVGRNFLVLARDLIERAADLEREVSHLANGTRGWVDIGYVEGAVYSGVLPNMLRRLRQLRQQVEPNLHALRSAPQIAALTHGRLDIGFMHNPPAVDDGFQVQILQNEPLSLVLPSDHALAEQGIRIGPKALDGAPFILLGERLSPRFRERLMTACSNYGFKPKVGFEASDIPTMLGLVSGGLGFSFAQASLANSAPAGVTFRNLSGFPLDVKTYLVARSSPSISLIASAFFSIAEEMRRIETPR